MFENLFSYLQKYVATSNGERRCSFDVIVFDEGISLKGNYLVQPDDLAPDQENYRDIPVIEGDQEFVHCIARAEDFEISWDLNGPFNASSSGETTIDDFAIDILTVNIVNATAIDEKSIWCDRKGKRNDTIENAELLFKAFVPGRSDFPPDLCRSCNGTEYFKLSKATKQNTDVDSLTSKMKQKIEEKVMKKYGATDVVTDVVTGNICGCT